MRFEIAKDPLEFSRAVTEIDCIHARAKFSHIFSEGMRRKFGDDVPTMFDVRKGKVKKEQFTDCDVFVVVRCGLISSFNINAEVFDGMTLKKLAEKTNPYDDEKFPGWYYHSAVVDGKACHVMSEVDLTKYRRG